MKLVPNPMLSSRMQQMDTSAIRRMFDLSAKLSDPINLSIGKPHFPTPPPIIEALSRSAQEGHTAYTPTQGILALREAMAQKYRERNGFEAHPDNILISSGVASLIQLLFLACVEKGSSILLSDPAFLIYKSLATFFGAQIKTFPENFNPKEMDIDELSKGGLKLIIICHPSNPSGHVYTPEQLQCLAKLAKKGRALLVSDEIYELYDYDHSFQSAANFYPNTLTLSGFSKSYSMTGLRLAAAHGPPDVIRAMITLQQYTVVCAPSIVQHAGLTALKLDMSQYIQEYKKNRDYCLKRLQKLNNIRFHHPSGAFYIFIDILQNNQEFCERAIQEKQLLLVPGHIFSASQSHIRISYAVSHAELQRGMDALVDLLNSA